MYLFVFLLRDFGWQHRYARFCGRVVVLSILSILLYPLLWAWTVIGTLWFRKAKDCVSYTSSIFGESSFKNKPNLFAIHCLQLPKEGQKWGFLIWLLFSYCALLCIACMSMGKVSGSPMSSIFQTYNYN